MSKFINLLLKVHDSVHLFETTMAKKQYSEPKLYIGGGKLSDWPKLTKEQQSEKLKKDWYIRYSYRFPDGKLKRMPNIKGFANTYHTKEERTEVLTTIKNALVKLLKAGFNPLEPQKFLNSPNPELAPFVKEFLLSLPNSNAAGISKSTPIIEAFRATHKTLSLADTTSADLRQIINRFEKGIDALNLSSQSISSLDRATVKNVLNNLQLTNNQYNKFLTYISIVISEIVEMDILKENFILSMRKKKTVKKIRETLELDELKQIADYLKINHYTFYRYLMIFFPSGARSAELMRLQGKDVYLKKQEYKALILKGNDYTEVMKVIIPAALPFWSEVMSEVVNKEHFIFSKDLRPGSEHIRPYQVTKRWKRNVKDKLGFVDGKLKLISEVNVDEEIEPITADFYSLKALFLDELDKYTNSSNENLSQNLASHTTSKTTDTYYLVGKKERAKDKLKNIDISPLRDKETDQ